MKLKNQKQSHIRKLILFWLIPIWKLKHAYKYKIRQRVYELIKKATKITLARVEPELNHVLTAKQKNKIK